MPLYESTFIARQDMSQQDVSKLADSLSDIISQGGGKVVKKEYWGLKNFAYRIEKQRKGHYTMLCLDTPADALHEMERSIRINEDILRVLTIKVDEHEEGPSAQMQQSKGRDDEHEGRPAHANEDKPAKTSSKDDNEDKSEE